jgi:hypothetical protein
MVEFELARRQDAGGKTWVGRLKNLHARSYLSVKPAQRQYPSPNPTGHRADDILYSNYLPAYIFDMECEKCLQMRFAVVHILSFLTAYCLSSESLNCTSYGRRHDIHLHRSIFKSNFRQVAEISRCPVGAKCHRPMPCILHYRQSSLLSSAFPIFTRRSSPSP